MNLVIVDIAIGLVFVYLIYSLFLSLIVEIISTWLGMRSRMLRQGIGNLLNDHKERTSISDNIKGAIGDFFLFKKRDFLFSKGGEFYNHPSVKYLSVEKKQKYLFTKKAKPAYIRRSTFSSTLIDLIREKGLGVSDWQKIKFSIEKNAGHFDPETSTQLKTLLADSDDDMDVFIERIESWYDEMMERVNGWYKRRVRFLLFLLSLTVVVLFNVNTFKIINILSKDNDTRESLVNTAMSIEVLNIDTSKTSSTNNTKNIDSLRNEIKIIKNDIDNANMILGLGYGFDTIVQPIKFNKFISNDKIGKVNIIAKKANLLNSQIAELNAQNIRSVDTTKRKIRMKELEKEINELTVSVNKLFGISRLKRIESIKPDQNQIFNLFGKFYHIKGHGTPDKGQQALVMIKGLNPFKSEFWGLWLTALALCLGAPFWFDIMKRLISIKNVGINGDEKKPIVDDSSLKLKRPIKSNRGKEATTQDPALLTIAKHRQYWESIHGVQAINHIVQDNESKIQIVADIGSNESNIFKQLISAFKEAPPAGFLNLKLENPATIMVATDLQLENDTTKAKGTCAGIILNNKTGKKAILSCAHVLQSDKSAFFRETKKVVNGPDGMKIGLLSNQIKSNFIDAAIADLSDQINQPNFDFIPPPYQVSPNDWENTKVMIFKRNGAIQEAIISQNEFEYFFQDNLGKYKMYRLIAIYAKDNSDNLIDATAPGDSGALVCLKQLDQNQKPIKGKSVGIIVGGLEKSTTKMSFVIPMAEIINSLDLKIINTWG